MARPSRPEISFDTLRRVPIFDDLSDGELGWILEHAEILELAAGDSLWKKGDPAEAMVVVIEGELRMLAEVLGQTQEVSSERWGGVVGLLPYSRMTEYPGDGRAAEASRVLRIPRACFHPMLGEIPELGYRLVGLMSDRVREGARVEKQREKMMALGKLSAGLAHELNNPAAAMGRAVDELGKRLEADHTLVRCLVEKALTAQDLETLTPLRNRQPLAGRSGQDAGLSPIERGQREDEIGDWLEEHETEDGWVLAEALAEAGITVDDLDRLAGRLPAETIPDAIAWIEAGLATRQLLAELATAAARISELVGAVKSYSHMDQAPDRQPRDLHRGLDQTLTILGHKLRKSGVQLERRYDRTISEVPLFASEINQVWTNLLDNALDAAAKSEGEKRVVLETKTDERFVYVCVTDTGPGIAEEISSRIFEPFFTTKEVGEGTGLGLEIVQRIVSLHGGEVTMTSEPGKTAFTVRLPLE